MSKELIRSSVFLEEEKTEDLRKLSYFTRNFDGDLYSRGN